MADFASAKIYIDVKKVYTTNTDTISPEAAWEKLVMFNYNLSQDKKFTNIFPYHTYDIEEKISGEKAKVSFKSKDSEASIKSIIYHLELLNSQWVVVKIDYIKN